jgi:AraC family transcriptional regulator
MRNREYFGKEVHRASFGGLLLTENTYAPNASLPRHQHANAYFMLVLAGGLVERSGSTEFECGAATLVFHSEGAAHANRFGPSETHCFGIEFDTELLRKLAWSENYHAAAAWVIRSPTTVALMYKLRNEIRQNDRNSAVMIEGLALTLLGETARSVCASLNKPRVTPRWLNAARDMIHEEFQDDLTATAIARSVGVHPVTLARSYRSVFGTTVGEALRERRLHHGMRLLSDTELPITVIALTAGFADHSHFSRAFRQQFGTTPQQFRRTRCCSEPRAS